LCYPSHATHIYQGLDVVVFASLKKRLSDERDKYERTTGQKIDKTNFLTIYGTAHIAALTPDLVKTAFRKTGVYPFNPAVVTEDMLAPSKETSEQGYLPVEASSHIRVLARLLRDLSIKQDQSMPAIIERDEDEAQPTTPTSIDNEPDTELQRRIRTSVQSMSETDLAYLVSESPAKSTST
jgi:hypothetical protein